MAITKVSNSSLKNLNKYDSFLAGNAAYDPGATFLIARTSPTSGTTVTFSSIPSTYKNLQIRASSIHGSGGSNAYIRFNSDSGSNYVSHALVGTGSAAAAYVGSGPSGNNISFLGYNGNVATYPNTLIMDIVDYANTSKNKTVRTFWGADQNSTGGSIELTSGLWMSTSAINSITFTYGYAFTTGTTFALYGLKG